MDWIADVDWEKLANPNKFFTPLVPKAPEDVEDPFYTKVVKFKRMLMDKYLWLPDEHRTEQSIDAIVGSFFAGNSCTVIYEVGGFVNIIPGYKCEVTFKIWDKDLWNKSFVRAGRELLDLYTKELRLKRMSTSTADIKMVKFTKMFGFKEEGRLPNAFRWREKFYTKFLLGRYGE